MDLKRVVACLLAALSVAMAQQPLEDTLTAYRQRYETLLGQLDAQRAKVVQKALETYQKELNTLLANVRQQGNLDYVLAVQNELKRLETDPTPPKKPAPKEFTHLRTVQWGFVTADRESSDAHDKLAKDLKRRYAVSLAQLEKRLVAADNIEEAKKVRQEVSASRDWEETVTVPGLDMKLALAMPGEITQTCRGYKHDCGRKVKMVLSEPYWIGIHEVTQEQYEKVMATKPARTVGKDFPVECVSWYDAMEFCEKLTEGERKSERLPEGYEYRLPTEAEWRWAESGAHRGEGKDYTLDVACGWFKENSEIKANDRSYLSTHAVGQLKPNAIGLFDMMGNVSEWCLDEYIDCRATAGLPEQDPRAEPAADGRRTCMGGSSFETVEWTSFARIGHDPATEFSRSIGFRVVLAPKVKVKWERKKGTFAGLYYDHEGKAMVELKADGTWASPAGGFSHNGLREGRWEFHPANRNDPGSIDTMKLAYYKDGKYTRTYNTWVVWGYRQIRKWNWSREWLRK